MKRTHLAAYAVAAALAWPQPARAALEAKIVARAGGSALSVAVDVGAGVVRYRVCPQGP